MLTIISPAKNMKIRKRDDLSLSKTAFPEETEEIIKELKKYQPYEL